MEKELIELKQLLTEVNNEIQINNIDSKAERAMELLNTMIDEYSGELDYYHERGQLQSLADSLHNLDGLVKIFDIAFED